MAGPDDLAGYHILFVVRDGAGPLIAKSKDANVLTVGEANGFFRCGGTLHLSFMEPENMRIAASLETARPAALRLSARLLSAARISD